MASIMRVSWKCACIDSVQSKKVELKETASEALAVLHEGQEMESLLIINQ